MVTSEISGSNSVLITAAMELELSLLVSELSAEPLQDVCGRPCWHGRVGARDVYLAATGIGKVNAAVTTSLLLDRLRPGLLINTGCGGAYRSSGLSVGDIAIATAESYGDEGVFTPEGWQTLEIIGIPSVERNGKRYSNDFPLSMQAAEKAYHLAVSLGMPVARGRFVTVSSCSGTDARAEELEKRFRGVCENMEGAASAHTAVLFDTPFMEIRGISNLVEDRDIAKWDIPLAVETVQRFLARCLERRVF